MSMLVVQDLVVELGKKFRVGPVHMEIAAGLLRLEGPNGSGKTTLMRAMSGGLKPTRGWVRVLGEDVHRKAKSRLHIAYVPAIPELPECFTVREAFQFTASMRRARDWDGARFCAELSLDPNLSLSVASAGQRQKAELVCGLAGDPDVLLLDEPFTHLDEKSLAWFSDWLSRWAKDHVVAYSQHGIGPLKADAILRLNNGQVALQSNC